VSVRDAIVYVLLAAGVGAELICCIGLVSMRNAYDRLHYAGAATTVGPVLIAAAVLVRESVSAGGLQTIATVALLFLLGPVVQISAQPTGRDVVSMHLLDVDLPAASVPSPAPPVASTADDAWTVAPGDSFWSIATETLRDANGDEPSEDDVLSYWRVLLDANDDNLAVPGNPDLLFAGQVVVVPPVSAA